MTSSRYLRSAGNGRADDGFKPTARERKPTLARDGYEVLTERSDHRYGGERPESKELTDRTYEQTLAGGYFNEEC